MFDKLKSFLFMSKRNNEVDPRAAYSFGMDELREFDWIWPFDIEDEDERKQAAYEYVLKVLKIDMFGSDIASTYRGQFEGIEREWTENTFPVPPMPDGFTPKGILDMPFDNNTVIACPPPGENIFFPELGLIILHENDILQFEKWKSADVKVYPLELCFPYYYSSGYSWVDSRTQHQVPIHDISFALLYDTAQWLWNLKEKKIAKERFHYAAPDNSQRKSIHSSEIAVVVQSGCGEKQKCRYESVERDIYKRIAAILRHGSSHQDSGKYCMQLMRILLNCTDERSSTNVCPNVVDSKLLVRFQQALDGCDYCQACTRLADMLDQRCLDNSETREQIVWILNNQKSTVEFFPWDDCECESFY